VRSAFQVIGRNSNRNNFPMSGKQQSGHYLKAAEIIDSDRPDIRFFASEKSVGAVTPVDRAICLYLKNLGICGKGFSTPRMWFGDSCFSLNGLKKLGVSSH
jgi:hypothetical protein